MPEYIVNVARRDASHAFRFLFDVVIESHRCSDPQSVVDELVRKFPRPEFDVTLRKRDTSTYLIRDIDAWLAE